MGEFPECKYMRISSVIRMGFFCFLGRNQVAKLSRRVMSDGNNMKDPHLYMENFCIAVKKKRS